MSEAILTEARKQFHEELVTFGPLSLSPGPDGRGTSDHTDLVASNADVSQRTSRDVAFHIATRLEAPVVQRKGPGQTAGGQFEAAVTRFLTRTFPHLQAARPGVWTIQNVGGKRAVDHLAKYFPYTHLDDLRRAIERDHELESILGNSYVVAPDILVLRAAMSDADLNASAARPLVDGQAGLRSPLRARDSAAKFVHAVISCKWTMRSDRSQNTRAEALNLIRNRKGRTPHIVAVTAEPSLSRIASLALGTGDIDMVYHAFLDELVTAIAEVGGPESKEMLTTLTKGDRLRDIADLPLDLAV